MNRFKKFLNKKGALELSITAITVLGFAIFFIKSLFGGATETLGTQFTSIQQKLRDNMENDGEILTLDIGNEIKTKKGTPTRIYVGLKNDFSNPSPNGRRVCFAFQVRCLSGYGHDCSSEGGEIAVAGAGFDSAVTQTWFSRFLDYQKMILNIPLKNFVPCSSCLSLTGTTSLQ